MAPRASADGGQGTVQRAREPLRHIAIVLQQVVRNALRGLLAHAGEIAQGVDQVVQEMLTRHVGIPLQPLWLHIRTAT
jgi:hypothetical protein